MTIKEMREYLGLSQAKFSQMYGIPKRTIENWESEKEGNKHNAPEYVMKLLERCVLEDYEKLHKDDK